MNIARFVSPILRRSKVLCQSYEYNGLKTCGRIENYITKPNEDINLKTRYVSTCDAKSIHKEEGLVIRYLKKIPFFNFNRLKIYASAYILYEGIADQINYVTLFEKLDLPDTFYSWFVITELYIWMLSVRVMAEGRDGKHFRNGLVEAFWLDVAQRAKKLGVSSTLVKQQVYELSEQLQAALLAYDEGLQADDTVLASALWRRFYQCEYIEPENLVKLVKHIRKQIVLLDNLSKEQIFTEKSVPWKPFNS